MDPAEHGPLRYCFSEAVLAGKDVRLDMGGVSYVDSAFVGLVVLLQGQLTQHRRRLLVVSVHKTVRLAIKYCRAEYLCLSDAQGASRAEKRA